MDDLLKNARLSRGKGIAAIVLGGIGFVAGLKLLAIASITMGVLALIKAAAADRKSNAGITADAAQLCNTASVFANIGIALGVVEGIIILFEVVISIVLLAFRIVVISELFAMLFDNTGFFAELSQILLDALRSVVG